MVGDLLLLARGESAADVVAHTVFLDDVASKAVLRAGRHPAAANRRIGVGQCDAVRVHQPDLRPLRRDTPGSGLGLAIVRWIAELHGETLTLTQQTNPRTKAFTIRLPVA